MLVANESRDWLVIDTEEDDEEDDEEDEEDDEEDDDEEERCWE